LNLPFSARLGYDVSMASPAPGLFLTLDGPDGGGKTTQVARLADWLRARGRAVVTCREPGGTALGEGLRRILFDRATVHLTIRAEMFLFMASRAQLVEEVIRPALTAGKVVISDRFLLASMVYQGYAGGLPVADVAQVGRVAAGGLFPDLTLVLDIAPEAARARVGGARDRIEDRPDEYQRRVREGFRRAAGADADGLGYPAPTVLIDAGADPDTVFTRICSEVERVLALSPRP
jgi:dTMP kinase